MHFYPLFIIINENKTYLNIAYARLDNLTSLSLLCIPASMQNGSPAPRVLPHNQPLRGTHIATHPYFMTAPQYYVTTPQTVSTPAAPQAIPINTQPYLYPATHPALTGNLDLIYLCIYFQGNL